MISDRTQKMFKKIRRFLRPKERVADVDGASLIASERERQRGKWPEVHDDMHEELELVQAAICYLFHAVMQVRGQGYNPVKEGDWPWGHHEWRPSTPIRDTVKAGALIAAEIDRLLRLRFTQNSAGRA